MQSTKWFASPLKARWSSLLFFLLLSTLFINAGEEWNPLAQEGAVVTSGRARFTILTPRLIRIQYSTTSLFEDRATFAVVNRNLPVPAFTTTEEDGYLVIRTDSLTLRYKIGSRIQKQHKNSTVLGITFQMNGRQILCPQPAWHTTYPRR